MKFSFLKAAAACSKTSIANPKENAKEIISLIKQAQSQKCELIVFGELAITGYTCEDLFLSQTLINASYNAIAEIAAYSKNTSLLIFVGAPILFGGRLFSAAIAIQKGKILGGVPKVYLPNYGEFYEMRHFTSGKKINERIKLCNQEIPFSDRLIFKANENLQIGVEICEDMFAPNPPSISLANAGAQVIVNLSASNELISKSAYRKTLIQAQSGRLACAYVYASQGPAESVADTIFSGHRIIAENGQILTESPLFETGLTITDIDLERLGYERRRIKHFNNNDKNYIKVPFDFPDAPLNLTRQFSQTPFVPSAKTEVLQTSNEILQICANALAWKLFQTKLKPVIGLSGGLDSTLALLIILRSCKLLGLDKKNIIAITMPGPGTSAQTLKNISLLKRDLQISILEIPINQSVQQHLKDISHTDKLDTTFQNAQARIRTQILMDIANAKGGLVVGTGDLSEIALGWATYNGDHMSMYGINAGIPKTLVKYLIECEAQNIAQYSKALNEILNTEISPELLPPDAQGKIAQKTQELIGPYLLHDFFLYYTIRFGYDPKKTFALAVITFKQKYTPAQIKKYLTLFLKRFFANQFKRNCMPDSIKVGSVSLSPRADWRMPSQASVKQWLDF